MIYLLYSLLVLMLMTGIGLLSIPFITTQTVSSKYFLFSTLFVTLFSLGLYQWSSNQPALKQWLTQGKAHYQLQQEINQLGGFAGMIHRIKTKLANNPDDAEGWFILGKLYFADQDYDEAKKALGKAYQLRPNDPKIKYFYDKTARH